LVKKTTTTQKEDLHCQEFTPTFLEYGLVHPQQGTEALKIIPSAWRNYNSWVL